MVTSTVHGVETFSLVYTLPATHLRPSHDSFMKLGGITTEYIAIIRLGTSLRNSSLPLFPDSQKISHSCTRVLITVEESITVFMSPE